MTLTTRPNSRWSLNPVSLRTLRGGSQRKSALRLTAGCRRGWNVTLMPMSGRTIEQR
jgi:hypothetical protein